MAEYHFTTLWTFEHPVTKVWDAIRRIDRWPEWWKYVRSVERLKEGDENEIGSVRRICWSTALPYTITFDSELTSLEQLKRMEGRAYGDLTGVGIWTFFSNNGITQVRYDWHVKTTKKWMQLFDPLARPLFQWNHDKVMKAGYEGLVEKLKVKS